MRTGRSQLLSALTSVTQHHQYCRAVLQWPSAVNCAMLLLTQNKTTAVHGNMHPFSTWFPPGSG
jgi:hypothetical protein